MTSQSPRIYTYKITFEEVPYYYYGSKKEQRYNQYYMGSPVTNKWCWELYTPKKQILEFFEYTDEGYSQCLKVENRLIKPVLNDPWCLNERCSSGYSLDVGRKTGKRNKELGIGIFALTPEQRSEIGRKNGKINGKRNKELGIGIHARTKEQMSEHGKLNGKKIKELGVGICGLSLEQRRNCGLKTKELGKGIFELTSEQLSENGKKGGKITGNLMKELGKGIFAFTPEQKSEIGRKSAQKLHSQKWQCLVTGKISTSGGLSQYQKARGIDRSKRIRIE